MNKLALLLLFAVLSVGIIGFSQLDEQTTNSNETLAIATISAELNNMRPGPLPITIGEHGTSMTQDAIKTTSNLKFATLDNVSIEMDGKSISLVDTRLRDNGAIYNYYGQSPITDSTSLQEFMKSGGIVVKTMELRTPTVTYTTLANHGDTRNSSIIVDGMLSYLFESHDRVPTTLNLYLDDGRVVSVWAYATPEDVKKIAEKLELQSGLINLNDYVDSKWTDGPERDSVEPEPIPEPES